MKRQEGSIFKLPLNGNQWVYARVKTPNGRIWVYDKLCEEDLSKELILQLPILFSASVFKYSFSKKHAWEMIDFEPLTEEEKTIQPVYGQEKFPPFKCKIFINGGVEMLRDVPFTQCIGMQPAAIWEPEELVERIVDFYEGRENEAIKYFRLFNPETGEKTNWPPF
jgi:hypothetical protein